jgi:hypothetical protein
MEREAEAGQPSVAYAAAARSPERLALQGAAAARSPDASV